MCGIIGYTGIESVVPLLIDGLGRLEYRGYDSSGIAVITHDGELVVRKGSGKLHELADAIKGRVPDGFTGVGHTRWATHGPPTQSNAHPHVDCSGNLAVVHNGIVENYFEHKKGLLQAGHIFASETDTEIIAHMLEDALLVTNTLEEALRSVALRLRGANAIVVIRKNEPDTMVAVRLGNAGGITVGYGDHGVILASDLAALAPHTNRVAFLEDRELVAIDAHGIRYTNLHGQIVAKEPKTIDLDSSAAYKGGYSHFMIKEILEQPETIASALRGRISFDPPKVFLQDFPLSTAEVRDLRRVIFIGMGTSYHACQVARSWVEHLAGIPSESDNSSEFRYREPILDRHTLVVAVGQSGETADTLAGMQEALRQGARLITICNAEGSQASQQAEYTLHMRAGLEVGVASTKTFTSALVTLRLLALYLGDQRGKLSSDILLSHIEDLASLPNLLGEVVKDRELYQNLAREYASKEHFLYLGRGINYPIAMEGALKLKEVSYIHAEGYPSGEMKHGPIALIDDQMPVVVLTLRDSLYEKSLGNISEIRARGGTVIALGTEGDNDLSDQADHVLYLPAVPEGISPVVTVVPLQLFAYELALQRGCDVDRPRNLAKTVTVE